MFVDFMAVRLFLAEEVELINFASWFFSIPPVSAPDRLITETCLVPFKVITHATILSQNFLRSLARQEIKEVSHMAQP